MTQTAHKLGSTQNTHNQQPSTILSYTSASGSFLDPDAAMQCDELDSELNPLHRYLYQAVVVACHVRLRATWDESLHMMHPPSILRWSKDQVLSAMVAFASSEAMQAREKTLVDLSLKLMEDPENRGLETVLIALLGGRRDMDHMVHGESEDEAEDARNEVWYTKAWDTEESTGEDDMQSDTEDEVENGNDVGN
ncbi:hypothetical protein EDC01DRAFT_636271 [Geopyxis carbonaria]|nr:hypothetical protein EDC01DRAFT_636271 [Geopyxis carbonaria]